VKLFSRGERVEDMFRMIEVNTRFPRMVLGDIESQIAGCLNGRDLVRELVDRHGTDAVLAAIELFWNKCEAATRDAISRLPDGVYRASSFLDDDGINPGKRVPINIEVRIAGDEITVDFSGVADQMEGPLNAGFEGGAVAAARIACKYVFAPDEPANDGAFRAIKVVCPPGKFLSARPPVAMGGSGSAIPTVVDTILRALADALPERLPAAHHGTYCIHMIYGSRPGGGLFQHMESTIGGWGAAAGRDGTGPFRSVAHGDTLEVPVELQEASYPHRLEWVRLRQDSGGAGRHRGGLGVEKSYELHLPGRLWTQIERTQCPPWGLQGGKPARPGYVEIHRDGSATQVVTKAELPVQAGDRIRVHTAGGGGYGDPHARTVAEVLADVRAGYVSRQAAQADYGVVISEEMQVDEAGTARLRRKA